MKFITEDGKIADGVAMTDRQADLLDRFEAYLHEHVCSNSYHGTYSKKPCREVANKIVPKLDDSSCGALLNAIFEPVVEAELEVTPIPEPHPVVAPVDDIPF